MRKWTMILLLSMGFVLGGCESGSKSEPSEPLNGGLAEVEASEVPREGMPSDTETESRSKDAVYTSVVQGGPYGQISMSLPSGWEFETYPVDSDDSFYGEYGVKFYPENAGEGYVTVAYIQSFGVCGTGLVEEETTVAGKSASVGTYDNNEHWDFIAFGDDYK